MSPIDQLELRFQTLRDFQEKYPTSHVGGSIGLMIHGIDLKRELHKSDLDITIDEFKLEPNQTSYEERSNGNDFDYAIKKVYGNAVNPSDNIYVKIDIRITPEPSYEVVEYNGHKYNVSRVKDILFWKKKYADKCVTKHVDDLFCIEFGYRNSAIVYIINDDFPF